MRISIVLFLFIGLLHTAKAQIGRNVVVGSGAVVSQTFNLPKFTGIAATASFDVYIKQDSKQAIEVKAQQNIIDIMLLEVKNGTLKLGFKPNTSIRTKESIKVYISLDELKRLAISGSGNIRGEGVFNKSDQLDIVISGSGDVVLNFETKEFRCAISGSGNANFKGYADKHIIAVSGSGDLSIDGNSKEQNITISGSGNIKLSGNTEKQNLAVSGSGNLNSSNLMTKQCNISITGSGNANVNVTEQLNATIMGSGNVTYSGNPEVNSKVRGSGSLTKK